MDKRAFKITAIYMPTWANHSVWTILVAERTINAYNLRYATLRAQRTYPYAASITVECCA